MLKNKKIFSAILVFLFLFFLFVLPALAALELKYPTFGGQTIGEGTSIPQYVKYIFVFSIGIAGFLAFAVLVWGGVLWLTSSGEPAKIGEAKSKILGALVGVVIILGSYLILTTINPDLTNLTTASTQATTGIYLLTAGGKEVYLGQSTPYLTEDSNDPYTEVKFVSGSSELTAVYIYPDNQYQGEAQRIENGGGSSSISVTPKKSLLFLWNKPGIYLYSKNNFEGNPFFTQSSIRSLSNSNFDNKANSIDPRYDAKNGVYYAAVVFSDNDYEGKCGLVVSSVPSLSDTAGGEYIPDDNPMGANNVSSLVVLNNTKVGQGDVTFYDGIDCKGCQKYVPVNSFKYYAQLASMEGGKFTCPDGTTKDVDKNILSFRINGNFGVVLNTEPNFGADPEINGGMCQFFSKPAGDTCVTTLKGSKVYDPANENIRVQSLMIIPLLEKVIQ